MRRMDELRQLSDDELREMAMQKDENGKYTLEADMAQRVRQDRSGYWVGVPRKPMDDYEKAMFEIEQESHYINKGKRKW